MLLVARSEAGEQELVVEPRSPDATVAELLRALGWSAEGIDVDGRFADAALALDEVGLVDGAVVEPAARHAPPVRTADDHARHLTIVSGMEAGRRFCLEAGRTYRLGRAREADITVASPTVSETHATVRVSGSLQVEVEDAGSSNGTWVQGEAIHAATEIPVGGLVRFGAVIARVDGPDPDDRPAVLDRIRATGQVPFNRPPRRALPGGPGAIRPPEPPPERPGGRTFNVIALVMPLAMAGALIMIYGDPRFALFMLLSPVMMAGNWLASRRQAKKEQATTNREFQQGLRKLGEELHRAVREEVARRDRLAPDPAETLRRASRPSTRLWERRPGHEDFLHLRVGTGDVPWDPPLTRAPEDERVREVVARHAVLPRAPVTVDLSQGGVVGIVGDRPAALGLARSLLCQAAVHHGPADLQLGVFCTPDRAPDWDWTKWLPHTRLPGGDARLMAADRHTATELLDARLEAAADSAGSGSRSLTGGGPPAGPVTLYLIDDRGLLEGRRAPARRLLTGAGGPAAGIVLASTADSLPASCTEIVKLGSELGDATVSRPAAGEVLDDVIVAGLSDERARRCSRALARFEDPELGETGGDIPQLVRLLPLLGLEGPTAGEVQQLWGRGLPDPGADTPIGLGADGIVEVDLTRDGPHGLVGGTTGSGKSELLRSMVAGMAARADSDHLNFVLVDYKGGSAFDVCSSLPHTVGMVTDLDEHLSERALVSLEAELRHREGVLREAGATDLPEYLAAGSPLGPLPRLLVVVDEFAALATELPDFVDALVGVAQRGRSLGVHMILATQRPSGAVTADIKANTNLRIALRVQDPAESQDIIDRGDAAELSRSTPGRAYIRRGHRDVVQVQTALSTAPKPDTDVAAVGVAPFGLGPSVGVPGGAEGGGGPSELALLVDAISKAFEITELYPPRQPWLPMLPESIPYETVADRRIPPGRSPWPWPTSRTGNARSRWAGGRPTGTWPSSGWSAAGPPPPC